MLLDSLYNCQCMCASDKPFTRATPSCRPPLCHHASCISHFFVFFYFILFFLCHARPSCEQDLEPGTRPSRAAHYSEWEASSTALIRSLREHHPVDGILGAPSPASRCPARPPWLLPLRTPGVLGGQAAKVCRRSPRASRGTVQGRRQEQRVPGCALTRACAVHGSRVLAGRNCSGAAARAAGNGAAAGAAALEIRDHGGPPSLSRETIRVLQAVLGGLVGARSWRSPDIERRGCGGSKRRWVARRVCGLHVASVWC
jgi:hypothetical protein